ncbi:hypothetical protein PilKf_00997 [Pillotina sp. SPG140]|jgi:hypothetical protein
MVNVFCKKKKILIMVYILCICKIYAWETKYVFTILSPYNGVSISEDNVSYEFTTTVFNYYIMDADTNVGIDISPIKYSYIDNPKHQTLSFINIKLYYNLFRKKDEYNNAVENIFGPFIAINWININNFEYFDLKNILYSVGLRYSWRILTYNGSDGFDTFNHPTYAWTHINGELGYRNNNGNHGFYVGIQILDPLLFPLFLVYLITGIR